jgi:hypothetical protein
VRVGWVWCLASGACVVVGSWLRGGRCKEGAWPGSGGAVRVVLWAQQVKRLCVWLWKPVTAWAGPCHPV